MQRLKKITTPPRFTMRGHKEKFKPFTAFVMGHDDALHLAVMPWAAKFNEIESACERELKQSTSLDSDLQ